MSKKTKEIILIAIICVIKLSLNVLPIILIVKEWDTFVGLVLGSFVFFAFLLYYFTSMDSLPEREITYGEFPFEIVYSIDEEAFEKQGIAICKCKKISIWHMGRIGILKGALMSPMMTTYSVQNRMKSKSIAEVLDIIWKVKNLMKNMFRENIYGIFQKVNITNLLLKKPKKSLE